MKQIFKNRIFLAVICIALAAVVGFAGVPLVNSLMSANMKVVRVVKDVNVGTQFTEDMLEIVDMGRLNMGETVCTDVNQVIGQYATADYFQGDIVYATKLSDIITQSDVKIKNMDADECMHSFAIGNAFSGKLLPNDIITIYSYNETGDSYIVPELQYVQVVCETTAEGEPIQTSTQTNPDGSKMVPTNLTLILSQAQMKKMLDIQGNYTVVLKYRMPSQTKAYEAVSNSYLSLQKAALKKLTAQTPATIN